MSELALIFVDAEVKQLCWDRRVEHKVAVEESGQVRGMGRGQPSSCQDKLNSPRTLRASESCTYVEHVAGCGHSGYCWPPRHLGECRTDQASAETLGNGRTVLGGGVDLLRLQGHDPDRRTVETELWRFDCSERVGEGRGGRQHCKMGQAQKRCAAAEREPVAGAVEIAREEVEEDKRSRRVLRGDLVREIVRMVLRKDRGLRVDNSIGILLRVVDIPLREDVIGDLGGVRRDLGRSSAGQMDSPLDRASIRRCSARTDPRLARKSK